MRVVRLCAAPGGSAYRLHTSLRRLGVDSLMLVVDARDKTDESGIKTFRPPGDRFSRLRRRFRRMQIARSLARYRSTRPATYGYFFDDRSPHDGDIMAQLPPCDVITVHMMDRLVGFREFFSAVPSRIPIVRTLPDMSFFTGGCHYTWGCDQFVESCGACPQLGSRDAHDLSNQIWRRKREALRAVSPSRLHLVAPSKWMAQEARSSSLLRNFPVTVIPHGVDIERFRPRDRGLSREMLDIPQNARVVLFVSEPLDRPEKGFTFLTRALEDMGSLEDLLLVLAGSGKPSVDAPLPQLRLGNVADERMMSLIYSAADLLVIPSIQENYSKVAVEAIACGTPVVGFAVGGVQEIVRSGVNGLLVPAQDVPALSVAMRDLLWDSGRRGEMASNCRRIAIEEYTLQVQARRYLDLYHKMLAIPRSSAKIGDIIPV